MSLQKSVEYSTHKDRSVPDQYRKRPVDLRPGDHDRLGIDRRLEQVVCLEEAFHWLDRSDIEDPIAEWETFGPDELLQWRPDEMILARCEVLSGDMGDEIGNGSEIVSLYSFNWRLSHAERFGSDDGGYDEGEDDASSDNGCQVLITCFRILDPQSEQSLSSEQSDSVWQVDGRSVKRVKEFRCELS